MIVFFNYFVRLFPPLRADVLALDYNSLFFVILSDYFCHYVQMVPASDFGLWDGPTQVKTGSCGEGGYFNDTDGVCTCTEVGRKLS